MRSRSRFLLLEGRVWGSGAEPADTSVVAVGSGDSSWTWNGLKLACTLFEVALTAVNRGASVNLKDKGEASNTAAVLALSADADDDEEGRRRETIRHEPDRASSRSLLERHRRTGPGTRVKRPSCSGSESFLLGSVFTMVAVAMFAVIWEGG